MKMRNVVWMTLFVNLGFVSNIFAWGFDGHKVVADIGWNNLSDPAKAGVAAILGPDETMYSVSTWADENSVRRGAYSDTYGLHFLNIEEGERDVNIMRDSYAGASVVGAISYYSMVLASKSVTEENRNMALKWLIHFVGDIHQPMHVSYRNDSGGNDIDVEWQGRTHSLHSLWDSLMIDRAIRPDNWEDYAKRLNDEITDPERESWNDHDPLHWAKESVALAFSQGYDRTSRASSTTIDNAYYAANIPIVEQRLKMAGARLAGILNRIFE